MSLFGEKKQQVMSKHRLHESDTGSPEIQIALLSERINGLAKHFESHQKDHSCRRGLLMMVGQRRRLLVYLKQRDQKRYKNLVGELGLRG